MTVAPDLKFDAGLVDTLQHGRDRSYTVADCLDLVASAGLVFREWLSPFSAAVAALPEEKQWSIMERVNSRSACHFFTAAALPARSPADLEALARTFFRSLLQRDFLTLGIPTARQPVATT